MLRPSNLPLPSELPTVEDDPALFDPSPEWFVPGLKASPEEHDEDGGLGLRSLIERPEALRHVRRSSRSHAA